MSSTAAAAASEFNDLIVSAQDTFEEVLGWYGLRPYTPLKDHCAESGLMDSANAGALVTKEDMASVRRDTASFTKDAGSVHSRDSSVEDGDVEVDGDHPVDLTCVPPVSSCSSTEQGAISDLLKMQWGSHKKLVGIRFLFPPLDEQMSLLEKARIWVARHDYKYFVDWTDAELDTVDPILRPLSIITRDIYKLHMNRSEYCRNVKLKYCLQSDAPWAQQFRENLGKSPTEGGFTGLCQAKIVAAELWRKYSEHYRSHQARHPHLRNRDVKSIVIKALDGDVKTDHETSVAGSCYDALCTDSDALSDDGDREIDGKFVNRDGPRGTLRSTTMEDADAAVQIDDEVEENGREFYGTKDNSVVNLLKRQIGSDVEERGCKKIREEINLGFESRNSGENAAFSFRHPLDSNEFSNIINLTKKDAVDLDNRRNASVKRVSPPNRETSIKTEVSQEPEVKPEHRLPPVNANSLSYWNMSRLGPLMYQLPMAAYYANPMTCFLDSSLSSPSLHHQIYPFGSASPNFSSSSAGIDGVASLVPLKKSSKMRGTGNRNEINTEYRRSERGLSFLFPSFSDHNMSLMEKVRITITRHKNNYFLGWDEAALDKLDPLVRPKMMVTPEIYKEYCHRNAMKYDSNLQFAMESAEPWAQEFRKKLSLPASEGGFTSLCEVKLEAGRLWREYSGKYRMHNIVKWQMDLNSNAVPAKPLSMGATSFDARGNKIPFRKLPRRQKLKDQQTVIQRSKHTLQHSSHRSLQSVGLGSSRNGSLSTAQSHYGYEQLSKGSGCSSPLVGSFSEGASPRVNSSSELPTGEACRVSRSLDNSPSMGGSTDGSASNASIVVDASCSPALEQSPRATSTPQRVESRDDFLFTPLPRQMPVADQLFLWLERHNNNYFLGFQKERLASLHAYLRPQVVVTRDVFQRHIPESMVDVLGKIKWMMSSSHEWAVKFCDRVRRPQKDGGFSTFEEALTEAVVLWHMNKDKEVNQRTTICNPMNVVPGSNENDHYTSTIRQLQKKHKEIHSKFTDEIEPELSERRLSSNIHGDSDREVFEIESDNAVRPRSLLINEEDTETEAASMLNGGHSPSPCVNPSSECSSEAMIRSLWKLRHTLNALCQDSPVESWEQRLAPFLPVLKQVLGSGYTVPASNNSCMVDLILAALHQHIEEVFSNL